MSLLSKGSYHRRKKKPKLTEGKKKVEKKEIFEEQKFPIEKGRFKGLNKEEYQNEIRRLRKMKKEYESKKKVKK